MNPLAEQSTTMVDVTSTPLDALLPDDADPALARAAASIVHEVVQKDIGVQLQEPDDGDWDEDDPPHRAQ
jgi:hypothetical protein